MIPTTEQVISWLEAQIDPNYTEMARIGRLSLAGCDNMNASGECCEQGKTLNQMCPKCREYWTEACKFTGQDPNEVIAEYQKEKK